MKKLFLIVIAITAFLPGLEAERPASIHTPYTPLDSAVTPAPKGYTPFYISHYGRHGSRYHASNVYIKNVIRDMSICDSLGLLTAEGKQVLREAEQMRNIHEGMTGILTQKGCSQHRKISSRMYRHYGKVFSDRKRPNINCVSSPIQRCIQSMTSFCLELKGNNPALNFDIRTGPRYFDIILPKMQQFERDLRIPGRAITDSVLLADVKLDRLENLFFRNPEDAHKAVGRPLPLLILDIYANASIAPNLDEDIPDTFRFFTDEEAEALCYNWTSFFYSLWCRSVELGDQTVRKTGGGILKDIISKADDALKEGSNRCADLRFGHDSGLTPLLAVMGVEGFDKVLSISKGGDWNATVNMCMASNLQMIFFHNKAGDIIVKILHNERETTIPALKPFSGPYYRWSDLRAFLLSNIS